MISPLTLKVYDSYKKSLVEVNPLKTSSPNTLLMYSCGPTVYGYQHIGNLMAAFLPDLISKVAKFSGWEVNWVLNITDVGHLVDDSDDGEDKIEKGAKRDGKSVEEIIVHYLSDYILQTQRLHFSIPSGDFRPRATQYILEQMLIALTLLRDGKGYVTADGIYYDSSQNDTLEVPFDVGKGGDTQYTDRTIVSSARNPGDFILWKFVSPESLQKWKFSQFDEITPILMSIPEDKKISNFEDIWGSPGWHSECVAMIYSLFTSRTSKKSFSFSDVHSSDAIIDIHTGGEDHIDVHHRNEILQSESLGFHLSRFWVHNKHVLVDGQKMSKSIGNVYRIDDLIERGFSPVDYRMMLLEHHYSQQLNFTWDKLKQSRSRLHGIRKDIALIRSFAEKNGVSLEEDISDSQRTLYAEILYNDLHTDKFLEIYQKLIHEIIHSILNQNVLRSSNYTALYVGEKEILQLDLWPDIPQDIYNLAELRISSKQEKDYQKADQVRERLEQKGWSIGDYAWGFGVWISQ